MTAEQKVAQLLTEAYALETALVHTLSAHIGVSPRGEYRALLERHVSETREQAAAIEQRLGRLRSARSPLDLLYGLAQAALGQLLAATKLPLDLLRGSGAEEKLLKNARDAAAGEALEIATYDALEALADAAGDAETAALAREHRAQEERFLAELRALIPTLARDVLAADVEPPVTASPDAARAVTRRGREAAAQVRAEADVDLPIDDYDDLTVQQVLPKLRLLSQRDLARIDEYERGHRSRKSVLERIEELRDSPNGGRPAGRR